MALAFGAEDHRQYALTAMRLPEQSLVGTDIDRHAKMTSETRAEPAKTDNVRTTAMATTGLEANRSNRKPASR